MPGIVESDGHQNPKGHGMLQKKINEKEKNKSLKKHIMVNKNDGWRISQSLQLIHKTQNCWKKLHSQT